MVNKIKMVKRLGGEAKFTQPKSPTRPSSFSSRQSTNANRKFIEKYNGKDLHSSRPKTASTPSSRLNSKSAPAHSSQSESPFASSQSSSRPNSTTSPRSYLDSSPNKNKSSIRPDFLPSWLKKR